MVNETPTAVQINTRCDLNLPHSRPAPRPRPIEPNIQSFPASVPVKQRKNRAPMSIATETHVKPKTELPRDVYLSLVDSLFGNFAAMLAGGICVAVAATLTAWKTQDPLLWACAADVLAIGIARAIQMRRYEQDKPKTIAAAKRWEFQYAVGARRVLRHARDLVPGRHRVQRRPDRPSAVRDRHRRQRGRRREPRLRPALHRALDAARRLRAARARPAAAEQSLLRGDRHPDLAVLPRAAPHHRRPARDQSQGGGRVARGLLAREPLRHRAQQHAARPVHVRRQAAASRSPTGA